MVISLQQNNFKTIGLYFQAFYTKRTMHEQCKSIYYRDGYNRAVFRHNCQEEEANVQGCIKERAGANVVQQNACG